MLQPTAEIESFVQTVAARATATGATRLDSLLPLVYDELRTLAAYLLRGRGDDGTLRPTALAHEAYLRLADQTRSAPRNPGHLVALSATMMRRVLVDYARQRGAVKRGGDLFRIPLSEDLTGPGSDRGPSAETGLLALDLALERLEGIEPRKARVVELLYFAGLTHEEAGQALEVSTKTIQRDWEFARAWLWNELA